ncbi:amidohydrolase [Phenylobacterium montanum]|uniref:Amidohydrolase n=1 Tax=Phenylobacterium montanum TaxID=2823693 RepID=A0A975IX72_9CAUL|nr:amidohydrolase [Caulobacter sp. S6]QUD89101.1 amidohydrolase [Caulobacter sp. S6]
MSVRHNRVRRWAFLGAAVAAVSLAGSASALDVPALKAAVDKDLDGEYGHLDGLYKDIHNHPELGFQEARTAAVLAKEMRALGFEVTEGVGKTGIVAVYKNGAGPTVLVRTELDALPVQEKTGLAYASTAKQSYRGHETFVDHACGHDIHMAAWVGTAHALVAMKSRWHGTLMFIGQPAEEMVSGAKGMIDDGLFTRFPKPDYGFALHVGPGPYGFVSYKAGVFSSTSDELDVTFHGRGGHGSMPNLTVDPVMEAARFIVDLQGVVSREKDPSQFGVISIGSIQAGNAGNVIPDTAELRGTIRSYDPAVRERMIDGIKRTANGVAMISGAPAPDVAIVEGGKAVVNDDALTERTAKVFKAAFGDHAVAEPKPGAASEDYSEFIIAGVPSTYFGIGGLDPKMLAEAKAAGKPVPANHSPFFAPVPEPSIRTGVEAMTLAVIDVMQK